MNPNPQQLSLHKTAFIRELRDPNDTRSMTKGPKPLVSPEPTRAAPPQAGLVPSRDPWKLIMYIGEGRTLPVSLDMVGQLLFGRSDPAQGFRPDFDLVPFGGQNAGVSRKHALMFASGTDLYLRDLGSTNGTRVNGRRLQPNQTCRLREGDKLEMGHLHMVLHLARLK